MNHIRKNDGEPINPPPTTATDDILVNYLVISETNFTLGSAVSKISS